MKRVISVFLTALLFILPLCVFESSASYNSALDTSADIVLLISLEDRKSVV